MSTKLPQFVVDKLNELSVKCNIPFEQIVEEYMKIFSDPFVQTDPQFRSDEERYKYALEVVYVKLVTQPTTDFSVIPFGVTDVRLTKQGLMARVYTLLREKGSTKDELGVIILREKQVELLRDIKLLCMYKKVKLMRVKGTHICFAHTTTRFEDPTSLPVDAPTFFKKLGFKEVKIAETVYNLSRVDKGGFVDEFDLRIVTGIVLRYNYGKRPSGTDWALYTIADDSVSGEKVTKEGYIIPSQFTVWVPKTFLKYDVDSKLMFVGTIQLTKDKEPFMNAIYVHPIYAKPLVEV